MTEPTANPIESPADGCAAVRTPGRRVLPPGVVPLLWVTVTMLLGAKVYCYVFVGAPDLLVVFIAMGLAIAVAKRMDRGASLWTLWSFVLPPLALVLSQLRKVGSTSKLSVGRLIVRTTIVVALMAAVFFGNRTDAVWLRASQAMPEIQEYLLTTLGYDVQLNGSRLEVYHDSPTGSFGKHVIVSPAAGFPFAGSVLMSSLLFAACLYRSGSFVIVSMAVMGLIIGIGGDILGRLFGNLMLIEGMGAEINPSLMFILQLAAVYALAAKVGWETTCEEFPTEPLAS